LHIEPSRTLWVLSVNFCIIVNRYPFKKPKKYGDGEIIRYSFKRKLLFKFVTADNKSDPQLVNYQTFIRKYSKSDYIFIGIQLFIIGWLAGICFNIFLGLSGSPFFELPANPIAFYPIALAFPVSLLLIMSRRNAFLTGRINEQSSDRILDFYYGWRYLIAALIVMLAVYYSIYGFHEFRFFVVPLVISFYLFGIFTIFDKPLTQEGEIYILFNTLIKNSSNYGKLQSYWKKASKKIERQLRRGEIAVSRNDLNYYFSKRLMETKEDITNDLICFREWLLGNQRSCYDALVRFVPKEKIHQCSKDTQSWFSKNPDKVVRYIFAAFLAGYLVVYPNSTDTSQKISFVIAIGILVGIDIKDYIKR